MKTKLFYIVLTICLLNSISVDAQNLSQNLKGIVIDEQTTYPLIGASVEIPGSDPVIATVTDVDGTFILKDVPLGRHTLLINYIGYQSKVLSNVIVASAKETYLEIPLEEWVQEIENVVIVADEKNETNNENAFNSSRSFTLDEAVRYAGSLNDPARMAANYAGVTITGDMRNDIIVRGNSPNGIIYHYEGIQIPNPNHFGTFGASGGIYSMFSQNVLAKSDFLTGAFPAEYGNALGGVFDIKMRKGNSDKREYAFLFGMRGIEFSAEGPFSKNKNTSYLINYRYSTIGVFKILGIDIGVPAVPDYQDLSFKIHHRLKNGSIKVFGIGGIASINLNDSEVEDPEDFFTQDQPSDLYSGTRMGVLGVSHKHFFSRNTFSELIIAGSQSWETYEVDTLAAPDYTIGTRQRQGTFEENKITLRYTVSHKINAKNKFSIGAQGDYMDLKFLEEKVFSDLNETNFEGNSNMIQAHGQWLHKFTDQIQITAGLYINNYELNNSTTVEPRLGAKWIMSEKHSLNAGFGIHSQNLPSYAFFISETEPSGDNFLKYNNVNPMMSRHYIIGYNYMISKNLRLKIDAYYQDLYNIPVEQTPSYWSAVNLGGDFGGFPEDLDVLVNEGTGTNYGIELTLERFFDKGFYFLNTISLYDSKYKGSDGIERNTAFNGQYVVNLLAGKEFNIGRTKENTLAINFKATLMGGKRYIPINRELTQETKSIVYYTEDAYSKKYKDYFRPDIKISYNINKAKVTHQISVDIQNIANYQNLFQENYNIKSDSFTQEYQTGLFPEVQYRIMF
jgi:hypothetical protein